MVVVVGWGVAWDGTLRARRQGPEESDRTHAGSGVVGTKGGVEWGGTYTHNDTLMKRFGATRVILDAGAENFGVRWLVVPKPPQNLRQTCHSDIGSDRGS